MAVFNKTPGQEVAGSIGWIHSIQDSAQNTYAIKDKEARSQIEDLKTSITGGIHYVGQTSTALTDGDTTAVLAYAKDSSNKDITSSLSKTTGFEAGDIVVVAASSENNGRYKMLEFIWNGTMWSEFGSSGSLGALAFKNSATGTVSGTLGHNANFSGTQATISHTVSSTSFTDGSATVTPLGSISVGTGAANYTPAGTVSKPAVTVTLEKVTNKYVATSESAGGKVNTAGTAADFSANVSNECMSFSWTPNTPTDVTMPSFSAQNIATGTVTKSELAATPTFTGTGAELVFTGEASTGTASGTVGVTIADHKYTPAGSVSVDPHEVNIDVTVE